MTFLSYDLYPLKVAFNEMNTDVRYLRTGVQDVPLQTQRKQQSRTVVHK